MYPITNWKKLKRGYRFKEKTFYSKHHLGLDLIIPTGKKIRAPFKGEVIRQFRGKQGGLTVWFKYKDYIIRFLHNSGYGKKGKVKEGDVIAYSGNTGSLSTGAHSHIDISKNSVQLNNIKNFLDPEEFNWDNNMKENKVKEILRASKKYLGVDAGKRISSSEDREIAKQIKKLYNGLLTLAHENYKIVKLDLKEAKFKLGIEIEKNKKLSRSLGGYHTKVKKDNEEIKRLTALVKQSAKDTSILDALSFAFKAIINR